MKKWICMILIWMLAALTACAETASPFEAPADLYESIPMSAWKTELDKRHAFEETQDGYFLYDGGVLCAFYESGRLWAKARAFDSAEEIAPEADIPLEKLSSYKQGMLISEVENAFGAPGLEIMKINLADEDDSGVRRVLVWKTEEGNVVQALFELDDNEWKLFAIAEVK